MCVLGRLVCAGAREGSSREASDSSRDGCKGLVGHGTIGSAAIWVQWAVCVSVFFQQIFSTPVFYIKMTRVTSTNLQGVNLLNLRDNGWIHKWRTVSPRLQIWKVLSLVRCGASLHFFCDLLWDAEQRKHEQNWTNHWERGLSPTKRTSGIHCFFLWYLWNSF